MKFLFFCFFSLISFSMDVSVKVNPKIPMLDEEFDLIFEVQTDSSDDVIIDYDLEEGIEDLKRVSSSVSINTSFLGGSQKTERRVKKTFSLSANRTGQFKIKNIVVKVGDKTKKIPTKMVTISGTRQAQKDKERDFFLEAKISKKNIYVGEQISVEYALYNKIPIAGFDIINFPELSGFMKRHIPVVDSAKRVNINGQMYEKRRLYFSYLYPTKAGTYEIDKVKVRVKYASRSVVDPFDVFSFGFKNVRTRIASNEVIQITAVDLPPYKGDGINTNLIGDHKIGLDINKDKFLQNEAIEITLNISGEGRLEDFEFPQIIETPELEKFDMKSDFKGMDSGEGRKKFYYTFLGRKAFESEKRDIKLAFFDPKTREYIERSVTIPRFVVAASNSGVGETGKYSDKEKQGNLDLSFQAGVEQPIWELGGKLGILNILGIFLFLLFIGQIFIFRERRDLTEKEELLKKSRTGKLTYGDMVKLKRWGESDKVSSLSDVAKDLFKKK